MGKKSKANALGRALIKDRFGHHVRRTVDNNSMLHTTDIQDGYDWGRLNLQSVTEESSFQDFLRTAELAGTEFQAEKLNFHFINPKSSVGLLTDIERKAKEKLHTDKKELLKIPRRPKWTNSTTTEELQEAESKSFLDWRRGLATLQENDSILMTPYEKNLEFWRQLWRVIERSDVIVQIVDARNPLLFRSEDLEAYVKEVNENKSNMILINKADFLTEKQRIEWCDYFDKSGVKVAFFSALLAAEEQKTLSKLLDDINLADETSDNEKIDSFKTELEKLTKFVEKTEQQLTGIEKKMGVFRNCPKILNRDELISLFKNLHEGPKYTEGSTTIGLVGYPNVGKSSTINSLLTEKKVSVSATPGKTRHFQTLFIDKDLILCDCPGLVMPSFVLTKADMILNGILPIDQMRDHVPPVNLVCTQIPRHVLEDKYGIVIAKALENEDPNRPPFAEELLLAYSYNRGFMTANGQPDQSRGARYILKDYVTGKLLYCYAPPSIEQTEFHIFPPRSRKEVAENELPASRQRALRISKSGDASEIDKDFFGNNEPALHIKGRTNFPHIRPVGCVKISSSTQSLNVGNPDKPWRNQKKEKREKLRRKFAHLDQH